MRVCVRARVRGREELGRDGGAEEAGEQVQGAGRQAAAGADPAPEHPILHSASRFLLPPLRVENGRDFAVFGCSNVSRGCRQDVAERLLSVLGVSRLSCSWISGFQCEFAFLVPRGSAGSGALRPRAGFLGCTRSFCVLLFLANLECELFINHYSSSVKRTLQFIDSMAAKKDSCDKVLCLEQRH